MGGICLWFQKKMKTEYFQGIFGHGLSFDFLLSSLNGQ